MIIGEHARRAIMLSAIISVERSHDHKKAIVHTSSGESETYDVSEFDSALRSTVQASFPADGAVLLVTTYDDYMKPCDVWRRAILGFYLDATAELRAVTIDGNVGDDAVILFADGHVEQFEERWDTLDDYKRHLVETGKPRQLVGADG